MQADGVACRVMYPRVSLLALLLVAGSAAAGNANGNGKGKGKGKGGKDAAAASNDPDQPLRDRRIADANNVVAKVLDIAKTGVFPAGVVLTLKVLAVGAGGPGKGLKYHDKLIVVPRLKMV